MNGLTGLAWASLRHRSTAFAATATAVLLGTVLVGSFATLVETAVAGQATARDQETLTVMGAVVGGWGAAIVLFSVASTLGVTVRQRTAEIGLLRTVGATPRQARQLVWREAGLVTVLAAALGALAAAAGGRGLLAMLRAGGLVSGSVEHRGGPVSLSAAAALVTTAALAAAALAARRATRAPTTIVLGDAATGRGRTRWYRVVGALLLIGYGVAGGVVTVTVTADAEDPYAAMSTAGYCSIAVGLGLALLAPSLLRLLSRPLSPLLQRSAAGHLAAHNTARRPHLLAGVLAPVIVLTSTAVGTLMLVSIDGRTLEESMAPDDAEVINLLNNVVVGMFTLFAAIMVVNAFAAVTGDRRAELHRLWLVGATPDQVRRSVLAEAAVVAGVGVAAGVVASLATAVPFAVARGEGVVPDGTLWLPPLVAAGTAALTIGAAATAVTRALRRALPLAALAR